MIRSTPAALAGAAVLVLALAGCSGTTVDVPEGAQPTIATQTPAATAAPATTGTAPAAPTLTAETLDCAQVLPVETVESVLDLPEGFATPSEQLGACAWSMAGNPTALLLQSATGATLAEATARQTSAVAAVGSDLGEAAFFQPGDPALDPSSTLTVLAGDRLVSLRSSVGGQDALEMLAEDVLAALGETE